MRRALPGLLLVLLTAAGCAIGMGRGRDVPLTVVAVRAEAGTPAAEVADAIRGIRADYALVASPADASWFADLAAAADLQLSGPGMDDGLGLAFLGAEALGDTTVELSYGGGTFAVQDALYGIRGERFLDLMAFRVERPEAARPMIASLMRYVATDVMPHSAVVIAVAVPDDAVGDSVARMLGPGYFDARRCASGAVEGGARLRLFHGPEARIRCRAARSLDSVVGAWVQSTLVIPPR